MKIALINCYFGTLPGLFPAWLASCGRNPAVDFFLITDATLPQPVPENVKVIPTRWEKLLERIEGCFSFPVALRSPYKLTDFKPAYGHIFRDLLEPYDYWGYCDVDLVFGDLWAFLREPLEQGYEKIYELGHLTLYKNTERNRLLYRQRGGVFSFRQVYAHPEFYSFDEHAGQILISKKQGIRTWRREDMADISCRIHRLTASRQENYPDQVFYCEDGAVRRAFLREGRVETQDYVYIHLQKRRYEACQPGPCYYILPDQLRPKAPGTPDPAAVKALSGFVSRETDEAQLAEFRRGKWRAFFRSPLREKRIWLRIKLAERLV